MNTLRFFAALLIALLPMMLVAFLDHSSFPQSRTNAGWAIICSILLLSLLAYQMIVRGWRA